VQAGTGAPDAGGAQADVRVEADAGAQADVRVEAAGADAPAGEGDAAEPREGCEDLLKRAMADVLEDGTVTSVMRKGYIYNDRVLRPSLVAVSRRTGAQDG